MQSVVPNFQIKKLAKEDTDHFKQLVTIFRRVFEEKNSDVPAMAYLGSLLENPNFIVLAAMRDDAVLGGLTAFVLPMYRDQSSEIFIYDIGVLPEFQRKGIGRQLLHTIRSYGKIQGGMDVFVDADAEDVHALEFYSALGGSATKVVQFTFQGL